MTATLTHADGHTYRQAGRQADEHEANSRFSRLNEHALNE